MYAGDGQDQPAMRTNTYRLIISLLVILTYPALYFFRHLDDNRLTSWRWVFHGVNAANVFLILVAGVFTAFILSRISISRRSRVIVLFLLSFAASVSLWAEPEVIVDTSRYFTEAKHLEIYGIGYFVKEWGRDISAWTDMPLVPFFYGLIFKFFGESRIYIQIFTSLLFSLSALLTYRIGKELWDEDTGLFGGMLLLGMPYLLTQVPLMLVDVPTMFFLLLAVFTFISALNRGGLAILVSAFSLFLSFYSKYSAWLMLSILVVIVFVYAIPQWRKPGMGIYLSRASLAAVIGVFLIGAFFLYKFDVFSAQMKLLMEYQKPGLKRWGESFVSTFFFQINPFISLTALYSIYAAVRKKDLRYAIILWLVLLVVGMGIRRIRYIIMVFPMLSLMASYGIVHIKDREIGKFISVCIIIFSLTITFFVYLPFIEKTSAVNLKEAGRFLDSIPEPNVEVFTLLPEHAVANPAVSVPILDLFTRKNIIYGCNMDLSSVPREEVERSSLRFTWEYSNPEYYRREKYSRVETAVAVISNGPHDKLLQDIEERLGGCRLLRVYDAYEGVFRYRTSVRIFRCGANHVTLLH